MLKQERHTAQLSSMDRVFTRAVPVYAFAPFWKINHLVNLPEDDPNMLFYKLIMNSKLEYLTS